MTAAILFDSKQKPFAGQATSTAPAITAAKQRSGEAAGQGMSGLAVDRSAGGPAPFSGAAE